jgi:hypothetical protein
MRDDAPQPRMNSECRYLEISASRAGNPMTAAPTAMSALLAIFARRLLAPGK